MSATATTLKEKSARLFELLVPYHQKNPAIMQAVQTHAVQKTGEKLTKFLNNPDTPEEKKVEFVDELIDIATRQAWDQLPGVPKGQADERPNAAAQPPAKPAPVAVVKKPAPAAPPPPADSETRPEESAGKESDPYEEVIRAILKLRRPPPSAPGKATTASEANEAVIRHIVRQELAKVFETIAEVLAKK